MAFWSLLSVASIPVLEVLMITLLGAFLATGFCNILTADARKHMNKIVFMVFTPSLMFASLANTVTLEDIISWWFMPVNIGLTFLFGGILGWLAVKILRPDPHLRGLVIGVCSAGNLGNLLLIIIPAMCNEEGSPFGETSSCSNLALSYASFSMALGGFFIWTYTYSLIRSSGVLYKQIQSANEELPKTISNNDLDAGLDDPLLKADDQVAHDPMAINLPSTKDIDEDPENQAMVQRLPNENLGGGARIWEKLKGILHQVVDELLAPPTIGAILGFVVGATPWLKSLFVGSGAPLQVIQDSVVLLGDGTIPCITLILGGNLTQGFRKSRLKALVIITVVCVRFLILPLIGIGVVRFASQLGLLSNDPLYHYVLMIQFTVPPAMNIGTMTQLFNVGTEECSVILLWTYLVAALAMTVWSTVYMWILTV